MSDAAVVLERLPAGRGTARGGHIPARASASLVVLDVAVACPPQGKVWVCGGGHGLWDSQPCCSLQRTGKGSWAWPGSAWWGLRPQQTLGRMPGLQGSAPGAHPPETLALAECAPPPPQSFVLTGSTGRRRESGFVQLAWTFRKKSC